MEIQAKKSLGQHFLNSKKVLNDIITASNIKNDETVLEIGPGTGILTRALLDAGAKVIAVEKDNRSIELLKNKLLQECESGQLKLEKGDILEQDPAQFGLKEHEYALISNIPYYITGAILEKFLENEPRPSRMVLLVQREVATRIIARDKKESILSVSVKAFGDPKVISKVSRGAFTPPPTVDSAILAINNISDLKFQENNVNIKKFFAIVRAGFAHKRKKLIRNLETLFSGEILKKVWLDTNMDENIRAEDLQIGQWFELSTKINTF